MFHDIQHFLMVAMPDMPPQSWWAAAVLLLVIAASVVVDIAKGSIPDPLIFFGMAGAVAAKGMYVGWPFAAHQMIWGLIAAVLVWGANEIWLLLSKRDLIDLGDAKWTMLAVTAFGAAPMVVAWVVALIVGGVWITGQKAAQLKKPYTHFIPFLFIGMVIGIWMVRLGGMETYLPAEIRNYLAKIVS